jgi:hypothetical protein
VLVSGQVELFIALSLLQFVEWESSLCTQVEFWSGVPVCCVGILVSGVNIVTTCMKILQF